MQGIIDADTHISEGEAMWAMMEKAMQPRRPIMLSVPEDTWYGNRNAFWLIDGEIYPKPAGKGSFALVTPSAQKVQAGRKDSTPATREMTDIKGRLADMDKLHTATQVVYPTLFLVYNTKDRDLEIALCRAYNRFLAQACAQASDRMKWVAVLPFQSMSEAVDEIRFAKENGAVGIFFRGIEGDYTLDNPYLFPVYEEAQKQNLSICVHTGCGVRAILEMFELSRNHTFGHTRVMPLLAFRDLIANKIPEQFPETPLRFHRGGGRLGAVFNSHRAALAEGQISFRLERRAVSRVSTLRRVRGGRGYSVSGEIHRRRPFADRLGLSAQRSVARRSIRQRPQRSAGLIAAVAAKNHDR